MPNTLGCKHTHQVFTSLAAAHMPIWRPHNSTQSHVIWKDALFPTVNTLLAHTAGVLFSGSVSVSHSSVSKRSERLHRARTFHCGETRGWPREAPCLP